MWEAVNKEERSEQYLGIEGVLKVPNRNSVGKSVLGAQVGLECSEGGTWWWSVCLYPVPTQPETWW